VSGWRKRQGSKSGTSINKQEGVSMITTKPLQTNKYSLWTRHNTTAKGYSTATTRITRFLQKFTRKNKQPIDRRKTANYF
jgi:hypothetical protein